MAPLRRLQQEWDDLFGILTASRAQPEIWSIRWMIEELRVSVYAQTLGTPFPVSEARVRRALAGVGPR